MQQAKIIIRNAALIPVRFGERVFHIQKGILQISEEESMGIDISLPRDIEDKGYPVGTYFIGGQSIDRDSYGRLVFSKRGLYLVPEKPAQRVA
jgi:hypothetical protein